MTDTAIITVVDQGITIHVHLARCGDPVSLGLRLHETGKAGFGVGRPPGSFAAALLGALTLADSRHPPGPNQLCLVADAKTDEAVAFSYEVKVYANMVQVKAVEHGRAGAKNGNGNSAGKVLYDGAAGGYGVALKVPDPDSWALRWLVEVISIEQDIYHRMFAATAAQASKLRTLIEALVKAKELKGGSVVPVDAFETRYTVDNLIGQLTDLLGAGAVKRAAAMIAIKPASVAAQPQMPAAKSLAKPPGKAKAASSNGKPKPGAGAGKAAK